MSASQTPHSALLKASHASSTSSSERLRKAVPNTPSVDLRRLSLPASIGPPPGPDAALLYFVADGRRGCIPEGVPYPRGRGSPARLSLSFTNG